MSDEAGLKNVQQLLLDEQEKAEKAEAERDAALAKLAEVTRERDEHWANFCERSGDFKRWQAEQKRADELATRCAESQAREAELRAALTQLCSWATPIEVEPAGTLGPSFNNEWRACVAQVRAALALPSDRSALDAAIAEAVARETARCLSLPFGFSKEGLAEHDAKVVAEARKVVLEEAARAVGHMEVFVLEREGPETLLRAMDAVRALAKETKP